MGLLRQFFRIFDLQVALIAALAVAATWGCIAYGIRSDLPSSLIAVAIVFPIVFSIGAAYQRREEALKSLAALRAGIASLYFAHRDWDGGKDEDADRALDLGRRLYTALRAALMARPGERDTSTLEVYSILSAYSRSNERLRARGLGATELSRINNFLWSMTTEFEKIRMIADYRTPGSLRAFSKIYLNVFPILYAPFYADIAEKGGVVFGYGVAIAYACVLVGLDNIQDRLENPFDGVGDDDVRFDPYHELDAVPPFGDTGGI
ncbi:MAG: hypothetical protein ABJL17_13540 [Parvibaculum sp.]|uniref:hypothetical protein n=1 Tax=Parvibaculum sp. TaxID=2024848 RepID=UPI0032672ECF